MQGQNPGTVGARHRQAGFLARVDGGRGGGGAGRHRHGGSRRDSHTAHTVQAGRLLVVHQLGQALGHIAQGGCCVNGGREFDIRADVTGQHGVGEVGAIEFQRQRVTRGKCAAQGEQVGLGGHKLHILVNHRLLGRGQARIRRARERLGHRAPLISRNDNGKVQAGGLGPFSTADRAVVKRHTRPGLKVNAVVVVQVAQAVGHHQLLRRRQ